MGVPEKGRRDRVIVRFAVGIGQEVGQTSFGQRRVPEIVVAAFAGSGFPLLPGHGIADQLSETRKQEGIAMENLRLEII